MRVSVVVPVYNPGPYLEACVASVLGQSMPAHDLELLLVDDGSTDDTPAYLDALAAEHEHVRVLHEPGSGWAGRPRNVGVRAARGEYVQLLDQDDALGREAMERMYAMAVRNGSDVVLGKVAGSMQAASTVFREDIGSCTVLTGPAMDSLTPHKLFRRAFLLEHDIWHPEGVVRLEDQLFMIEVYLQARVISVLADYPCYHWMRRDDGANTSTLTAWTEPAMMFSYIEQLLVLMTDATEPGDFRDALMERTLRVEILRRVNERRMLAAPRDFLEVSVAEAQRIIGQYYGPPSRTLERLAPLHRLRAVLAREGSYDGLMDLAHRLDRDQRPRAKVLDKQVRDGVLHVRVEAQVVHADGRPVVVVERAGRYLLDPRWVDGLPGFDEGLVVDDPLAGARLDVKVADPQAETAWFPPVDTDVELRPVPATDDEPAGLAVVLTSTSAIDPPTLGGGLPEGGYDVTISFQALGGGASTHPRTQRGKPLRLLVGEDGRARSARRPKPPSRPAPATPRERARRAAGRAVRGARRVLRRTRG